MYYDLGAYDAAEDQCRQALACPDGGRPGLHAPELTVLTLLHIARGKFSQAAQAAAQGLAIFDREGMLHPEWWEALPFPLAQGELALAQGDVEAATHFRERAHAETAFVAEHIGASELQITFLARTDVQCIVK